LSFFGGTGSSLSTCIRVLIIVSPEKGARPVSIS